MDTIQPDGEINRLDFQLFIEEIVQENYDTLVQLNKGITIYVYKQEPKLVTDPETGEQKPVVNE